MLYHLRLLAEIYISSTPYIKIILSFLLILNFVIVISLSVWNSICYVPLNCHNNLYTKHKIVLQTSKTLIGLWV